MSNFPTSVNFQIDNILASSSSWYGGKGAFLLLFCNSIDTNSPLHVDETSSSGALSCTLWLHHVENSGLLTTRSLHTYADLLLPRRPCQNFREKETSENSPNHCARVSWSSMNWYSIDDCANFRFDFARQHATDSPIFACIVNKRAGIVEELKTNVELCAVKVNSISFNDTLDEMLHGHGEVHELWVFRALGIICILLNI